MGKMDYRKISEEIATWIREKTRQANRDGVVLGLSGGIDSATLAGVARMAVGEDALGVIMPCHSNPEDAEDACKVADRFDLSTVTVELDGPFDAMVSALPGDGTRLARANIKPRLRMITLYYLANDRNYLVAGTGNRSELAVGYFTKYGDGGVDILPLGDLLKTQVRELARQLSVPEEIINKTPTAGLWEGQEDESELGLRYETLDKILTAFGDGRPPDADPEDVRQVKCLMDSAVHKTRQPPLFRLSKEIRSS